MAAHLWSMPLAQGRAPQNVLGGQDPSLRPPADALARALAGNPAATSTSTSSSARSASTTGPTSTSNNSSSRPFATGAAPPPPPPVSAPRPAPSATAPKPPRTSFPAGFPLSLSPPLPPLVSRTLPSPPLLDDDSDDDVDLPMLSQLLSQMKDGAKGRVDKEGEDEEDVQDKGGDEEDEGEDEGEEEWDGEEGEGEEWEGAAQDVEGEDGGRSDDDMYVDEELTNVKEEEMDDHTLAYLPESDAHVKVEDEAHETSSGLKQELEFDPASVQEQDEDESDGMLDDEDSDEDMDEIPEGKGGGGVKGEEGMSVEQADDVNDNHPAANDPAHQSLDDAIQSIRDAHARDASAFEGSGGLEGAIKAVREAYERDRGGFDYLSGLSEDEDGGENEEGKWDEEGEDEDPSYVPEDAYNPQRDAGDDPMDGGGEDVYVDPAEGKELGTDEEKEEEALEGESWDGEESESEEDEGEDEEEDASYVPEYESGAERMGEDDAMDEGGVGERMYVDPAEGREMGSEEEREEEAFERESWDGDESEDEGAGGEEGGEGIKPPVVAPPNPLKRKATTDEDPAQGTEADADDGTLKRRKIPRRSSMELPRISATESDAERLRSPGTALEGSSIPLPPPPSTAAVKRAARGMVDFEGGQGGNGAKVESAGRVREALEKARVRGGGVRGREGGARGREGGKGTGAAPGAGKKRGSEFVNPFVASGLDVRDGKDGSKGGEVGGGLKLKAGAGSASAAPAKPSKQPVSSISTEKNAGQGKAKPSVPDVRPTPNSKQANTNPKPTPNPKPHRPSTSNAPKPPLVHLNPYDTRPRPSATAPPAEKTKPKPVVKKHAYTKHHTHWSLDGSLLVQMGNVRYRVHRSRVGRVCGVVGRALGSGAGSSASASVGRDGEEKGGASGKEKGKGKGKEKVKEREKERERRREAKVKVEYEEDGMPLVRLDAVGVEREDWEALLDGMDDAVNYIYTPPPLPVIASLLRASHALAAPSFENFARRAFEEVWSGNLEDFPVDDGRFVAVGSGAESAGKRDYMGTQGVKDIRSLGVSATEAVLIGRQCGLPGVVKRGMYELVKSETFEQGEDEEGDSDEDGEGSESDRSVIVIDDSDDEMVGARDKGKGKATMKGKVNASGKGGKPKSKDPKKKKMELTQKDYMKLTSARSKLLSRWMRETAQFPEGMLPCVAPTPDEDEEDDSSSSSYEPPSSGPSSSPSSGRSSSSDSSSSGSENDAGEDAGGTLALTLGVVCTGWDPLAAREAHRKLVLQSGVQEAYMNDVVTGLGVLPKLNWGFAPKDGAKVPRGKGASVSGGDGGEDEDEDEDEEEEEFYGGFCEECVGRLEKVWGGARERVWRDCDVLFGVKKQAQKGR